MSKKKTSLSKKIFLSRNTIYSLVFSLIIYFVQTVYEANTLSKGIFETLSDNFLYKILIFFLSFFVVVLIIALLEELNNLLDPDIGIIRKQIDKWRDEQRGNLSYIIDIRFVDTIERFAKTHQGFINGMYDNYPHNFTHIFDENSENYEQLRNGTRSLYIWMKNINVTHYADFAKALLKLTKHSVYSTTYYDNKDFIKALTDKSVISWINEVNEKNTDNFEVKRIHMFKNNGYRIDGTKYTTAKDIDDFISLIKKNKDAFKYYVNEYILKSDEYKVWHNFDDILFYGEYLIFDNQIMIKYDEDFKTLELYVGKIVKEHSENFNKSDEHFMSKEEMLNKLNGK